MAPALRRLLEDEFAPDVAKWSQMLGRDLGQQWFGRSAAAHLAYAGRYGLRVVVTRSFEGDQVHDRRGARAVSGLAGG